MLRQEADESAALAREAQSQERHSACALKDARCAASDYAELARSELERERTEALRRVDVLVSQRLAVHAGAIAALQAEHDAALAGRSTELRESEQVASATKRLLFDAHESIASASTDATRSHLRSTELAAALANAQRELDELKATPSVLERELAETREWANRRSHEATDVLARQRDSYAELASQHASLEAQCISAARLIGRPTNGGHGDEGGSARESGGRSSGAIHSVPVALGVLHDAGGLVADLARAQRRLAVAAGESLRHAAADRVEAAATGVVATGASQAQHAEQLVALRAELLRAGESRGDAVAAAQRAAERAERAAAGEAALERNAVARREEVRVCKAELAAARAAEARAAAAEGGALQLARAAHREEVARLRHECATSALGLEHAARAASAQEARAATALADVELWRSECAASSAALQAANRAHAAALRPAEQRRDATGVHTTSSREKRLESELNATKTSFEEQVEAVMESDSANAAALEAARGALRRRDEAAARVAADALAHYELECDAARRQAAAASAEMAALEAALAQSRTATVSASERSAADPAVAIAGAGEPSSADPVVSPPQPPPATPGTVASAVSRIEDTAAPRAVSAGECGKAKKKKKKKKKKNT